MLGEGDNNTALIDVLHDSSLGIIGRKPFLQQDLCTAADELWQEIKALGSDPSLSRGITGLKHHPAD